MANLSQIDQPDVAQSLPETNPARTARQVNPVFKTWFGQSKVVDANGQPLRVYHGGVVEGPDGISNFRPGTHFGSIEQAKTAGEDALRYQRSKRPAADLRASTYPVYLSIKNPLRSRDVHDNWDRVIESAKLQGFDGIVYNNIYEGGGDSWIAFHPEQIQSAVGSVYGQDISPPSANDDPIVSAHGGAPDKTQSAAFMAWFGDWTDPKAFSSRAKTSVSYAVGPDKKPLVLYHSTNADFDTFKVGNSTINSTTFGDMDTERHAIFATPDVEFSHEYLMEGQPGANVMPVFMNIKSHMDMREGISGDIINDIVQNAHGKIIHRDFYHMKVTETWSVFDDEFGKDFVAAAKAAGYDGAIITENGKGGDKAYDVYVAFDPSQVKSAIGNSGTFDLANDNILGKLGSQMPATTLDERLQATISASNGIDTTLAVIASHSENTQFRKLARRLQAIGLKTTIIFSKQDNLTFKADNIQNKQFVAGYHASDDVVYLFAKNNLVSNILHEAMHASVANAIFANTPAAQDMRQLFNHVAKAGMPADLYGMTNLHEFVAEAFSNPEFQDMLTLFPAAPTAAKDDCLNAWEQFKKILKTILYLADDNKMNNVLDQILATGERLIVENTDAPPIPPFFEQDTEFDDCDDSDTPRP